MIYTSFIPGQQTDRSVRAVCICVSSLQYVDPCWIYWHAYCLHSRRWKVLRG